MLFFQQYFLLPHFPCFAKLIDAKAFGNRPVLLQARTQEQHSVLDQPRCCSSGLVQPCVQAVSACACGLVDQYPGMLVCDRVMGRWQKLYCCQGADFITM